MRFSKRILAATLVGLAAVPVAAQDSNDTMTLAQLTADLDTSFKRLDANGNGSFDKAEYLAARATAEKQMSEQLSRVLTAEFTELDANKDKGITAAEIVAKIPSAGDGKAALARIDADKNGRISLTEYLAQARVRATADPDTQLRTWDSNANGQVTLAEYKGTAVARFNALDRNRDGKITKDEAEKSAPATPQGR